MTAAPSVSGAVPPLSFQQRMQALRRDWQAQLPQRLGDAHARLQACLAAPADAGAIEELHRLLHTLAGSAGTFGLAEFGERARAIEHELARLMALPQRGAADFGVAAHALQALDASLPPP